MTTAWKLKKKRIIKIVQQFSPNVTNTNNVFEMYCVYMYITYESTALFRKHSEKF